MGMEVDTGTEGTKVWRGQWYEGDKGKDGIRAWRGQGYGGDMGMEVDMG